MLDIDEEDLGPTRAEGEAYLSTNNSREGRF